MILSVFLFYSSFFNEVHRTLSQVTLSVTMRNYEGRVHKARRNLFLPLGAGWGVGKSSCALMQALCLAEAASTTLLGQLRPFAQASFRCSTQMGIWMVSFCGSCSSPLISAATFFSPSACS